LMVRSQRRRVNTKQAFLAQLVPGDEVVTASGIIGRLVAIDGNRARVEVAPGVVLELLAPAITRRAPEPDPPAEVQADGLAGREED
jgi:preprotein translocase subunit YajC